MRPTLATIDLSALAHNLGVARARAPGTRTWAVVKANAYGHGLARAARAFAAAGTEGYALVELDGAVRLRESGYRQRIALLEGFFEARELATLAAHGLTAAVHNVEQVAMLEGYRGEGAVEVIVKVDTGMHRLGLPPADLRAVRERLQALSRVRLVGVMTHFADADDERGIAAPLERFRAATEGWNVERSLANSATVLRFAEAHADWIRPGIMLYGCSPFAERTGEADGLKPAMTLSSELIAVRTIEAGESVGYGSTFTARAPLRIGTVACGYADGYPRHAPTGTPVLVGGRPTRTLGRVSMDMLCVDLSAHADAGVGTPVVLWGEGNPVERVAAAAGTVGYELLCALAPRVRVVERP